nr:PREDICTED: cadherin EGF LAG seven-pass G-type receptor 3 [Struthio camelus australis]
MLVVAGPPWGAQARRAQVLTIRENVEEGYPILQLRATDVDSPPNANIRYRFVNERAAHAVFEIDPRSGLITTSGPVDREKMERYSLVVEANDQGREPGPRSATVKVYITVLDENDNTPQFSEKRYIVQVREDIRPHTEILRVTATDLDKDNNALVHYNIISGNSRGQFSIDSVTGEIQVVAPLDFEVEREYALRIRAQDAGRPPLSNNTGMASIQVVDINDHAPIFVSTPFQISVLENAPLGHSVIHIQAVDADYGENSRLEYKLMGVSADTPFVVNSATGWITVSGPLDRELVEHYFFGVEARDHGSPSLSASASVTITVMDVNDNRPEFTQKEYFIRLNEDAAVGTSVLSVTAIDRDVNSAITYQITGGNTRNRFSISTQGGVGLITLPLPLDYKQERRYVLTVTASDRTLRDSCHVHINITDANTHRPVFQSAHYSVSINEDRPVGSTVVVISATDDDVGENARITYYLEDNVPQFRIDPDSGAITLQAELDYEDQVTYTLAITAKDNGIPQKADTTYVEIMVNDVNDNAPQFVSTHYQGIISEDAPPFTSVLQISATDRDAHTNGRVQYTFQNGEDGDGDFTIEPTSGIIRTVRRLDRENVPVYELTAYAVDRGIPPQRTPVHIQVTIQDVNDNAPVFPAEEFEVLVKENSIVGSVVAQITAVDPDEGPNAQIMYQIVEGNIPEIFQMDIFSGELTALIDLDYETKPEYVIVVQATSAPLVSRATVHIKLIDQNDNSPVLKNFQILFNNYVSNKSNTFPSGVIGKVPAYDPDVSDRLFYTFERGNELHLLIVNQSSGELRLSRKLDNNRPLVASMLVTVTASLFMRAQFAAEIQNGGNLRVISVESVRQGRKHGIHSVTAQCVLRVIIITEEMLANSITVRLENMWQERFLSPLLATFLEGVATVLATPKEDIFIFNIQNDTDVGGTVLNVSFSALAPRGGHYFSSEELQEQLYMKRMVLTGASMLEVLPFDDNVCLREPCQNYMKCISVLKFDSSAPFIASPSTLFRPIHPITGLRCRCPQGFTGDYCETEINLCENCEVDSRSGRCVPGVCRNGGTCTNGADGGFRCQCPAGGFSTLEPSGLLLYNGRLNERHDFLAVEIIKGQLQLKYSTGESSTVVSPYLPGGVSDGQWHTLQLHYYNKPKVSALGVVQGPSKDKVAILTVDECDASVALQFGSEIGNYSCAAEGVQSSSKKSLDLTGPLLLGGVPNLPENFPVTHRDFVGCMRDLYIDSKRIDLASYIANNGTAAGCHAKHSFCDSSPCKNGGTCSVSWGTYSCLCPVGFGGKDCRHPMHHAHYFQGNSILTWDFKTDVKISVPWYLGLAFRTRQPDGVLLQAHAGQYTTLLCQLAGGLLSFMVSRGSGRSTSLILDQLQLSDGRWHDLQLELRDVRSGRDSRYVITLTLDFGLYQDTVVVGNELHGLKVKHLHVGGILSSGEVQNGLRGCIQGVRLGDSATGTALPKPSHALRVEAGCSVPSPCDSSPCPANSICKDEWQSYSCVCQPGYYGGDCVDVCHLNPCKNKSVCRRKPGSPLGYVCECGGSFFGQYCEHRMDQQCPKGWWGNPSCGPCNCDVNRGFDPDCNKTNGQCHCKEFHYRPKGSDTCLPCDCYPVGSSSRSCDKETGRCHCRPGVIGRQCNSCDSPFAEVTPSGCEVLYDGCPKSLKMGVWWPQTKFGFSAVVLCPKGSLGTAVRHCDEEKGWLEPDLFNCTSPAFKELSTLLEGLERNETELNTIEAKKLAHRLRAVTDHMDHYFGNDVHITYRLLSRLMAFESRQRGFGLTATQDAHFNENLLRAGSSVLAPENREHWAMLPYSEHGSASLMEQLRDYSGTLASNMKLTYLNPVGVITPNIMLSIDRMENRSHVRRRYPRYHSSLFRGQPAWDPHTHVVLPLSVLSPPKAEAAPTAVPTFAGGEGNYTVESSSPRQALPEPEPALTVIILIMYRTLGGLLPARYQVDRRSIRLPKNPVMNSPIVSVSVFSNHTFLRGPLDAPLVLEFRLLETANRSKPLCVQWNHSNLTNPSGFWTARDCELVYRNTTHVHCQCSQFGTFGVLMDSSHREQLEGDLETLAVVTYSLVSLSLVALLLTFSFLTCLKGLKSNTRGIHSNISVTLFFSELLFLLGINRTENQFLCTVIAILLHCFFLSTFAWLLVQGLHIYRMQTEARNVNFGAMRFYYAIGWGGAPTKIVPQPWQKCWLAVGLDPEGYGNPDFCWISIHDKLVWSFAGPITVVIVMNGVMFLLVAKMSCSPGQKETKKKSVLMTLRSSFVLLLVISTTWLFGLLAVNNSVLAFHYLYTVLCSLQGLAVLVLFCVLNDEVQEAWKLACLGKKAQGEEAARSTQGPNAYNNTALFEESGLIRITLGASTISSVSSVRSARTHSSQRGYLRDNVTARQGSALDHSLLGHTGPTDLDVAMFHRDAGGDQDSDSDSDLSLDEERSLSIPSSESEENVRLRGRFQRQFKRAAHSERLLTNPSNTTPKDGDGNDLMSYWPALGECEVHPCSLQKWGSERKLGFDINKDAANNNQPDLALTSGDENSLTQTQRQRKGILKNRLQYPPALQGLPSVGRMTNELSWYKTSTLGHRAVPAASYGRIYSGAGSLSQPASRYSSREQLDMLMRRQMSREQLSRNNSGECLEAVPSRHGSREELDTIPSRHGSTEHLENLDALCDVPLDASFHHVPQRFGAVARFGDVHARVCSASTAKSLLFRFLPFLRWLPRYPVKDWLLGDIISGFSVGIMHLPQGLAYALLAGLPPVTGLYSSFYPVFLYFFFGTSRHNSVGPFAVMSVMIGSVTDSLLPSENFLEPVNGTNMTSVNEMRRDAARVELVATLTVLVGIFQVALGLLQFGFVVTYLSDPLVRGYTTAASVHVLISQLKYIFGISLGEHSGPLSLFTTFIEICQNLPKTNVGTLVTAIIAMVAIFIVKELNHKFSAKLPMPIPIELITIIISTGISYGVNLSSKFGVSVVGDIPSGLKPPMAPNINYFGQVAGNAFAIAVVGYAICISLGKIFALKHGYKVDSNQELIALGFCNFLGGFFQCFAISCSMSRSLVQESTGGNSQVAAVIASLVILVTILKIGELFRDLPKAILAAIIIVNLKGMFKQFADFRTLWKTNRVDLMVWIVTFVATLLLNLDLGLAVSVAFALLTVIFQTQLPHYSILGHISDTDIYRDVAEYKKAQEVPGVKIFRSSSTIYFANAELYTEALKKKDMENGPGIAVIELSRDAAEGSTPAEPTLRSLGLPVPDFHTVILDFSPVNFMDTVSIKILKNIFRDFREIEVDVFIAGCPASVITQLEKGNFFSQTITKHHFFTSVHDAVVHVTGQREEALVCSSTKM